MTKAARAQQNIEQHVKQERDPNLTRKKPLNDGDWEKLLTGLLACADSNQLKAWSAFAATFAMPDKKRSELLAIFNSHKESMGKKADVA